MAPLISKSLCARMALLALGGGTLMLFSPPTDAGSVADAVKARRSGDALAALPDEDDGELMQRGGRPGAPAQLPPAVSFEKDLAYGPDPAQKLDVYLPQHARNAPVVFMVHGGAWMLGDKAAAKVVTQKLAHWLPQGIALVSINYRMSMSPKVLDQVDDVARALAFLQARAPAWGVDAKRVLVMGHSAGAHLVALLSSDPALAFAHGVKPWLGTVSLDSAALDVPQLMQGPHPRFYDRVFGREPAHWAATSPFTRLRGAAVVPLLMVCSAPRQDSCPAAQAFSNKVNERGGSAAVLSVELRHAEVNAQLGLDGAYTQAVDRFARGVGLLPP